MMANDNDLIYSPPIPPDIIRHAVWLYLRFTLSFCDVEDLLAERGLALSYETVRRWVLKFGPLFAKELRRRRHRPTSQWHLDEMAVLISGRQFWLWRTVDDEGEILDLLVQRQRDAKAAARRPCQTKSGPMHHGMRLARQVGIPSEDQAMTVPHSASAAERLCL
jgi:DDE domain